MKKQLFLIASFALSLFITSCSSDSNSIQNPKTLEGTWRINVKSVKTNYSNFDEEINKIFISDCNKRLLEQTFNMNTKRVLTTGLSNNERINVREEAFGVENDSILTFRDATLNTVLMTGKIKYSNYTMSFTDSNISREQLALLLYDIKVDPNVLDGYPNIVASYTVRYIKQ